MAHESNSVNHSHLVASKHSRVKTDNYDTGFHLGRQFRFNVEINKTSAQTQYFRFTSPVDFILQQMGLDLDSGAARYSAWASTTTSGTWAPVTVRNRNLMSVRAGYPSDSDVPYVNQITVDQNLSTLATVTGGTETNVRRIRCPSGAGTLSSQSSVIKASALPAGTYVIKIEPITGTANTDVVTGVFSAYWEEVPALL